ncbi:unnamed protein product [Lactuca saligna]|uniref:Uncharacterized protein n=1 Tax=Lactuca saligna TaxID=75948 RepID=A0AA35YUZ0_LACSI|nr:unnamed protein product [Lactuca saligna]
MIMIQLESYLLFHKSKLFLLDPLMTPHFGDGLKNCDRTECETKYLGRLRIAIKFLDLTSREDIIKGLPPELWSEENFKAIITNYGQVVVSFAVYQIEENLSFGKVGILTSSLMNINCESLVEVNSKIMKIRIAQVDIAWVPFKSHMHQLDECSSSGEDGNDNEGDDDEDCISETMIDENN